MSDTRCVKTLLAASCSHKCSCLMQWINKLKQYVCWVQILELMGGEHAGISEAAKGIHNIEITGPSNPSGNREND